MRAAVDPVLAIAPTLDATDVTITAYGTGDAEAAAHGAYAQMHVKDAQRKKRAA